MKYYSLKNTKISLTFSEALKKGLSEDKGLFFPRTIPTLPKSFFQKIIKMSINDIALEIIKPYIGESIDENTLLREKSQHLDNLDLRIRQQKKLLISNNKNKLERLSDNLNNNNPISRLDFMNDKVNSLFNSLNREMNQKIQFNNSLLAKLYKNIEILNPLSILDRGYAIVMNKKGEAIKSTKKVAKGEKLKARLSDGLMDIEGLQAVALMDAAIEQAYRAVRELPR